MTGPYLKIFSVAHLTIPNLVYTYEQMLILGLWWVQRCSIYAYKYPAEQFQRNDGQKSTY